MSTSESYQRDYFSLIDISASEERILCITNVLIPKMGLLDTASDGEDLKAGTKLELPLWMIKTLCDSSENSTINIFLPQIYREHYLEILYADPSVVPLSKWNSYYYEFALHILEMPCKEREEIIQSLVETFKIRLCMIMDQAFNPNVDSLLVAQLPAMERTIYNTGKKFSKELINWIEKGTKKIQTADVITTINMKKRKRAEMEID